MTVQQAPARLSAHAALSAYVRRRLFTHYCRLRGSSMWESLRGFCLFVGYGRSGHSAIGSIVDAHPLAAISHELDAVRRYFAGVGREALFAEIFWRAREQARRGRTSSRAGGGVYVHRIEGQLKDRPQQLALLGDKRGAGTVRAFAAAGVDRIDEFRTFVGLPVKILHVIRNPYDIVAAGMANGGSGFARLVPTVAKIRERHRNDAWLDVYHEDVIAHPRREIARIVEFLELPVSNEHLARCEAYLFAAPHRRRFEADLPAERRSEVEGLIRTYDFLERYRWDS